MNTNHYRQGSWLYVLRNGIAVVVSPDAGTERIQQLWELLGRNPSVDQLLNEVTRSFGTSVTGLPDFAVVDHRDSLRVFLRGDLQVRTLDGSGHEVHGRGVTTWNERTLPSSDTFEIRAGESADEDDDPWMPLDAGVVTASVLVVGELPVAEEPGGASGDGAAADLPATAHEDTVDAPLFAAPAPSWNPSASASPAPQPAASWDPSSDEDDDEPSYSLDGQTDSLATELLGARAASEDSGSGDSVDAEADQHVSEDEPGDEPGQGAGAPADSAPADSAPADGAVVAADEEAQAADDEEPREDPAAVSGQHSGDVPAHHHDADAPNDLTTTYDHLWDQFLSTPEGSETSDGAEAPKGAGTSDGVKAPDAPADANGTSAGTGAATPDGHGADQGPAPAETPEPSSGPAGQDESQNTLLPSAEAEESLIDEVPWARSGSPAPVVAPVPVPAPAQSPGGAATPPPLPPAPPSFPPGAPQGHDPDHDGHTVFRSELPAGVPQAAPQASPAAPANGPRVLARMCLRGHANPPTRTHCMICEEQIAGDAASVPRPPLGRLRLPSGETVVLDRNVILGRQPSVSRVSGGDMPHLVQVDSPKRDISRSHAEVRLEGWNVVLCDLNSSNGTVLLRDGQSPRRLGQAETALVLSGDVAELGDQVYIVFEDLP